MSDDTVNPEELFKDTEPAGEHKPVDSEPTNSEPNPVHVIHVPHVDDYVSKPNPEEEAKLAEIADVQAKMDKFHSELAELANGRTEDEIGLNEPYWKKRNEFQQYLHSFK